MWQKIRRLKYHFLWWSIFIIYEVVVVGLASGVYGKPFDYFVHYLVNIALFYTHACLVLPFVFADNRRIYLRLPTLLFIEICLYIYINVALNYWSNGKYSQEILNPLNGYNMTSLHRCLYFIGFATGYYYIKKYIDEKNSRLESEKRELVSDIEKGKMREEVKDAQNAYLKAQINPHFLFNALNYIFIKIRNDQPNTANSILELSEIIRFAVDSENGPDKIELSSEIDQVKKLIHLYSLIQYDQNNLALEIQDGVDDLKFIPLILLTLTENIFKHGNLAVENCPARIMIFTDKGKLHIQTFNLTNTGINRSGNNYGIKNIEQRLGIAYGENAKFEQILMEDIFIVKLTVDIVSL
jgi:two-component system LytT family sensor kinase